VAEIVVTGVLCLSASLNPTAPRFLRSREAEHEHQIARLRRRRHPFKTEKWRWQQEETRLSVYQEGFQVKNLRTDSTVELLFSIPEAVTWLMMSVQPTQPVLENPKPYLSCRSRISAVASCSLQSARCPALQDAGHTTGNASETGSRISARGPKKKY